MAKKAKAKKAAKKSSPRRVTTKPQKAQETQQADPKQELHETLRRINARFTGRVPAPAASSGAHEPEKDSPVPAEGVKNGVYRCEGSDWLMHVRNGAVVLFEKARADLARDSVINIPAPGTPDADKTPERPA